MIEGRIARTAGQTLYLGGTVYRLRKPYFHSSVITYPATAPGLGLWEDVRIRELYPRLAGIDRQADGSLCMAPEAARLAARQRELFRRSQEAENGWLRPCGGQSIYYEAYGTSYVVRAFPRAVTLAAVLTQGALPLAVALRLMEQLLDAVEAIHSRGLLHLDIDPTRIVMPSQGQLVLDYDCLVDGAAPVPGAAEGSCRAPEVVLQNACQLGPAADLYSCCAVLFEMVLGRSMTEGELLGGSLPRTLLPALLRQQGGSQSQMTALARVLLRGLHMLPQRRYASAAELRMVLRQI